MQRLSLLPAGWVALPLVLLFFFLALDSAVGDSPTMDEQNHVARGVAFLRTGDPRFSLEHPPLVNLLSALPVLSVDGLPGPAGDPAWEHREGWYAYAERLLWESGVNVTQLIFLARLPVIFLTLGLALVGYHFARTLWGGAAGLLAFFLLLFDPNVLAHGRYATTDLGGTLFLLLATFVLWRMWSRPWSWGRIVAAGLGLGLAFGSKLSTLAFVPIFAFLALLPLYGRDMIDKEHAKAQRRQGFFAPLRLGVSRLGQLLLAGLLTLPLLWLLYGLEWGAFRFQGELLAGLNGRSGPMPTFWAGLEQILLLSGGGRGAAFLLGDFSTEGFVLYFPVAFLSKTPLATLLLLLLAGGVLLAWPGTRRRALFLLLPAVLFFPLLMQSALNIGYRHLLPALALLLVLAAGLAGREARQMAGWLRPLRVLLPAGVLGATLWIHPHYLSYFNLAAGGPANGYNVLIDSNLDWGQDLLRLREWMVANDVAEVKLSWFGSADPAYYGIAYEPLPGLPRHFDLWWNVPFDPAEPPPGVYVISASNLWEIPLQEEKYVFPWFRAREPDARIGYSLLVYRVGGDEVTGTVQSAGHPESNSWVGR